MAGMIAKGESEGIDSYKTILQDQFNKGETDTVGAVESAIAKKDLTGVKAALGMHMDVGGGKGKAGLCRAHPRVAR